VISRANGQFWHAYTQLPDSVKRRARAAYRIFRRDPYHPSLQFKQIHIAKLVYSVRVGLHYRALGVRRGELIVWFWIGTHAEYDKVIAHL
jgi:hypothetical protein